MQSDDALDLRLANWKLRLQVVLTKVRMRWSDMRWFIRKQFLPRDFGEQVERETEAKRAASREKWQQWKKGMKVDLREKDLKVLCEIFRCFPTVCSVRVYGSRATGEARRASDVDLAVSAPDATPFEWSEVCEALENAPLIYNLDVVRVEKLTNERLKDRIAREGLIIYPG